MLVGVLFRGYLAYGHALGAVSLAVEATLAMPQVLKNHRSRSTQGLSVTMVTGWTVGDTFKLAYFAASHVPVQFLVCAIVQLTVDAVIFWQIFVYQSREGESGPTPSSYSAVATDPDVQPIH